MQWINEYNLLWLTTSLKKLWMPSNIVLRIGSFDSTGSKTKILDLFYEFFLTLGIRIILKVTTIFIPELMASV